MEKNPTEYDRYTTANLTPELVEKVMELEASLRSAADRDVILIAYEESGHNPT
ncbi:hypothetical protein [Halalkalibacter nanhaiisediminis]|uniref:Uncharacterized protein n=1 Tax=Halalkalibacter nanhaiisediminis TaxID=688079 RepID=A0A562QCW5_9BACI|nr:hypothetical protein [Halalkalibacter nanhaiisediminis]TWI54553.1 hypothetical protein IQ10_03107 [Halalkalibacter nanhaiisediminis]